MAGEVDDPAHCAPLRIRTAVTEIPPYVPGSTDAGLVKLSSNESPFEPLPSVLEQVREAARSMNRYPDLHATELIEAISVALEVPREWIVVGTGSAGVLQQILHAVVEPGDHVVHQWRSFEAYPLLARIAGALPVPVALAPDGGTDLASVEEAITPRTKAIIVCSPNNPTGTAVRRAEFEAFLARIPPRILVILDEAYVDYVRDPNAVNGLDMLPTYPSLCLLRTFSKAYGLAGLRVGYGLAHPPVANAMRKCAVPFGVSTVAQRAAVESLRRSREIRARVNAVAKERERVLETLLSRGWAVPESQANFVWLPSAEGTDEFSADCQASGVLVRPFAGEGCRVTIGARAHNDMFLKVADDWAVRQKDALA